MTPNLGIWFWIWGVGLISLMLGLTWYQYYQQRTTGTGARTDNSGEGGWSLYAGRAFQSADGQHTAHFVQATDDLFYIYFVPTTANMAEYGAGGSTLYYGIYTADKRQWLLIHAEKPQEQPTLQWQEQGLPGHALLDTERAQVWSWTGQIDPQTRFVHMYHTQRANHLVGTILDLSTGLLNDPAHHLLDAVRDCLQNEQCVGLSYDPHTQRVVLYSAISHVTWAPEHEGILVGMIVGR